MTSKTAEYYEVIDGPIRLDLADTLQDALDYRDLHNLRHAQVWVRFTDGTDKRVA